MFRVAGTSPGFGSLFWIRCGPHGTLRAAWVCFELPTVPLFDRPKSGGKSRRYFRGAGHGQGACGPLWKPRGSEEVARDSFHVSQPFIRFYPSPGPCLPEPLIRAPVRRPRPPSRAGHFPGGVHAAPTCNGSLCGKHQNHACQTAPRRGLAPAARPCLARKFPACRHAALPSRPVYGTAKRGFFPTLWKNSQIAHIKPKKLCNILTKNPLRIPGVFGTIKLCKSVFPLFGPGARYRSGGGQAWACAGLPPRSNAKLL